LSPANDPAPVWPKGDLRAVDVIDEVSAVVVAANGEIYITRDAGLGWQRGHLPAVASLESVSMANPESGWAVGEGAILRTDDRGASWRRQRLPMQASRIRLVSVEAIDSDQAIAVAMDGTRLATGDGGRIWRDVSGVGADTSESEFWLGDVACDTELGERCWAVGSVLDGTDDMGESWQTVQVEDYAQIGPIVFGIGRVEVEASERERFEEFVRANKHRTRLEWSLEPRISPLELDEIGRRRDPDALFEVIEARLEEIRSMIEESGPLPKLVVVMAEPPWDYADYLDDDPELLERYWSDRTTSQSSVELRIVSRLRLTAIAIGEVPSAAHRVGIAVGARGGWLRWVNGGERWITMEPISRHDLLDVGFGARRVVAVGEQGEVWLSTDAGLNWQNRARPGQAAFFDALRSVSFSPAGEWGLIVGEGGRMLRSTDGGVGWAVLTSDAL
jgi:photosystem II stability/assembly factor-like uncharacterized protein